MSTQLHVELLTHTPDPEYIIYSAYRQCYSDMFSGDIFKDAIDNKTKDQVNEFIQNVIKSGHDSPIEHVSFTFGIEGVSRALTHQLVRHRIATYSHQSQRYVDANGFDFIIPPHIEKNSYAREVFVDCMIRLARDYKTIQNLLIADGHSKTANEDARFVLPNACETKIMVTMNCRSLVNFFGLRLCNRCYDDKTEVLTKNGWKFFKDVTKDDIFYSLNIKTKNTEYVGIINIFKYEKNGKMVRVNSQSIDQLVTENHKFLISNCVDKNKRKFCLKEANDVLDDRYVVMKKNTNPICGNKPEYIIIPEVPEKDGRRYKPERKVNAKLFMRFLGFYLSDGCVIKANNHRNVSLCKGDFELAKKYSEILQNLTDNTVRLFKNNEAYKVEVHDWNLYEMLKPLGKAHDKYIPEFVWELDYSLIQELVFGLLDGDFSKKAKQYWTVSKKLGDDVQRAFFHIGYSGTMTVLPPIIGKYSEGISSTGRSFKIKSRPTTTYVVSLNTNKNEPIIKTGDRNPFSYEQYDGNVHCVELEKNHTLYIRRNGKCSWSGNSQWEIRKMATLMYEECHRILPVVFNNSGTKCSKLGYCPENEKFSCGMYKTLGQLLNSEG